MEISFFAGLAAREPEGKRAIPVTSKKRLCRFFDALNIAIVFVDYSYKNILSILIPLFLFDEEERRHRQCQQLRHTNGQPNAVYTKYQRKEYYHNGLEQKRSCEGDCR